MEGMKKWFLISITGRKEGPLRVKVDGPGAAIRYGMDWIDQQAQGNDNGISNVPYHITMVYVDRDQSEVVVGMSSK